MVKSNKGFTLVELIVVIAILAILAGIAIPAYSGYIKKAKDAAVITELDAIATAAQAADAITDVVDNVVVADELVTFTFADDTTPDQIKAIESDFITFYNVTGQTADTDGKVTVPSIGLAGTSYAGGATWTNSTDGWTAK